MKLRIFVAIAMGLYLAIARLGQTGSYVQAWLALASFALFFLLGMGAAHAGAK